MATNAKKMKPEEFPVQEEAATLPDSDAKQELAYLSEHDAKIAELAYYKAEQRGFEPGHEMEDWLEAERELTE